MQHVRSLSLTKGSLCDILWYSVVKRALCVGLWECIHWADQFEETRETTHWWESFPLSLLWAFHSETWSEKTYWRTAWCKTVIWSTEDFCEVTCWHNSTSSTPESSSHQHCQLKSFKMFEIVAALLFHIFSIWMYSLLYNSVLQQVCCHKVAGELQILFYE